MKVFSVDEMQALQEQGPASFHEILRVPALFAGLYRLMAGAKDPQSPHEEDEVYYVLSGEGRFTAGGESRLIGPGDLIYVPALEEHRFTDIRTTLELLVVFAPAEGVRNA